MIGIAAKASRAGELTLLAGEALGDSVGAGLGVADTVFTGSGVTVSTTVGVGALWIGSDESLQPKNVESIKTVPTAPITKFVLLGDFKLNGLDGTVQETIYLWH